MHQESVCCTAVETYNKWNPLKVQRCSLLPVEIFFFAIFTLEEHLSYTRRNTSFAFCAYFLLSCSSGVCHNHNSEAQRSRKKQKTFYLMFEREQRATKCYRQLARFDVVKKFHVLKKSRTRMKRKVSSHREGKLKRHEISSFLSIFAMSKSQRDQNFTIVIF